MKFLIDENLPLGLVGVLGDFGHQASHTKLLGLERSSDSQIWDWAVSSHSIVVSKDSDFVSFASRAGARTSLVRLRLGNLGNQALYAVVRRAWPAVIVRLREGEALVEVRV